MEFLGTKMHSQKYKWQQFYDSPIELTQFHRTNVWGSIIFPPGTNQKIYPQFT